MINHADSGVLPDEVLIELLTVFAQQHSWTELVHYQQVAAAIIAQHLTVKFHAFIQDQLSH